MYQFSCFCKARDIRLTTRQQRKKIKEAVPKCIENLCKSEKKKSNIRIKVFNASKCSSLAKNFVNKSKCAN